MTWVSKRRVRAGSELRYEDWLAGISQTAASFPGSQGTTILRLGERGSDYLAITQFENTESLAAWLDSADRESWMSKLGAIDIRHEEVSTIAGTERWLTLSPCPGGFTPRYKTAALILLGLYPLVLVLDLILGPLLSGFPRPVGLLISLLVSVATMVWRVLPWLTRVFHGWLQPVAAQQSLPAGSRHRGRTVRSSLGK